MVEDREDTDSLLDEKDEEIAAVAADDPEAVLTTLPHYYRGEVSQAISAQDRIDQTTNWAVTILVGLLTVVFSSPDMPAFLLLIGFIALGVFLTYEVRRYRFYDLSRARVRIVEENLFANVLDPVGIEHPHWREELSDDLRKATFKVTRAEALSRRLSRIYGLLFGVLGVAWMAKVTLFTPERQWTEAAELPGIPGIVVAGALGVFFLILFLFAYAPGTRQAKGEIYGEEPGSWKDER